MNEWISVQDRLPESTGETILIAVPNSRGISHGYGSVDIAYLRSDKNKTFYGTDGKYLFEEITRWMPLPELPKEITP